MIIKVSGVPQLTIAGSTFSATVPVATYDEGGWRGAETSLEITGSLSDSAQTFMNKLRSAASTWNTTLGIQETMQAKLDGLVGRIL